MGQKRYTPEQIIGKLRQAEVRSAEGARVAEIVRELGITEQTYYRWRKEYGGLKVDAGEAAEGAGEGERPAEASGGGPDAGQAILKEAAKGNF